MNRLPRQSGLSLVRNPRWVEASNWLRLERQGDDKARQALFEQYVPFAKKLATDQYFKRRPDNYELGDLEQWAIEALLVSIDRYDPCRRVSFGFFAQRRILGNIADGIAQMSEVGRQVRHIYQAEKERLASLYDTSETEHSDPLVDLRQLAVGLALSVMLEGTGIYATKDSPSPLPSGYDSLVWKNTIKRLSIEYERLPDPQPFIIRQHYKNGISFAQIATFLNVSRSRISQLHRKALALLRLRLGEL